MRNHTNEFTQNENTQPGGRRRHHHRGPGGHGRGRGPRGEGFGPRPEGFGPGRGPGRGRGRGRRGEVRTAILALLAEQPMNGYGLITAISERTQGLWRPSAGGVYPALGLLTDEGLIAPLEAEGKKLFELTEAGRAHVSERADEISQVWARVTDGDQGLVDIRRDMGALGMAVEQVVMAGDKAQLERAQQVLVEARKDVYRLLAGDLDA